MTAAGWLTVALGGVLTLAIRAAFPLVADRTVDVPPVLRTALRMIPAAALAALATPPFLRPGGGGLDLSSPELLAGLLAAVTMWRTRSVPLTLLVGFAMVLVLG